MGGILQVDTIQNNNTSTIITQTNTTTITIGRSGQTITIPSGTTFNASSASVSFPAGSITNTDIAPSIITGQTAETSVAGADSILIYDDSASALRKMTRTNFVSGVGGNNTPAFQALLSANQSITDNVFTKVQFNTELFDTNNCYDNSTNYRFTPTTSGKYYVYSLITTYSGGDLNTLEMGLRIYKNGSSIAEYFYDVRSNPSSYNSSVFLGVIIDFNGSSDYAEIFGFCNDSSGNPDIKGDSTINYSYFGAYKLIGA